MSLKYIFKEIERTVHKNGYTWDPDLKRWSNQGILMLNTAFTTTIGKVGTHYEIWKPFIAFVLDVIGFQNPGLVYVFLGKKAQEWMESVPENNYLFKTTHPASAAYAQVEQWDSGDIFNKVSQITKKQFNYDIVW
jgi:uracil-DNA glycosylase